MSVLLRGGRREALLAALLEPLFEPLEVFGVVEDGSIDADGEGVSLTDRLSDMSSNMIDSLIVACFLVVFSDGFFGVLDTSIRG